MFDGFSHDNIVKIKLPCQTQCKKWTSLSQSHFCFRERLWISLSHCFSLDIRIFAYAFSCSLPRSSCCILPILGSSLTFLRVFLDSLYAFYFLLFKSLCLPLFGLFQVSLKTVSPRTWILTISSRWQGFSSAGIVFAKYWELLFNYDLTSLQPAQNAGCKLFAYAALHLLAHVKPLCNA